jgi:hypothetical protein
MIKASLTTCLASAFDLAPFTFVAINPLINAGAIRQTPGAVGGGCGAGLTMHCEHIGRVSSFVSLCDDPFPACEILCLSLKYTVVSLVPRFSRIWGCSFSSADPVTAGAVSDLNRHLGSDHGGKYNCGNSMTPIPLQMLTQFNIWRR